MSHCDVSLCISRSMWIISSSFRTATTRVLTMGFCVCATYHRFFFFCLTEFEEAHYFSVHTVDGCCIVLNGESFSVT